MGGGWHRLYYPRLRITPSVESTITGRKYYQKYVESHKISCAEEIVSYWLSTGPCQVCSNNLKQPSLNLYWSALGIHSAMNLFCYCAESIYNKVQKCQVSALVEILLFTMFEFNWQKTNRAFAPLPLWHTFGHMLLVGAYLKCTMSAIGRICSYTKGLGLPPVSISIHLFVCLFVYLFVY